jgi:hypothetical protein
MASIPIPKRYRTIVYIPSRTDGTMLEVCLSIPMSTSSQPQAYTGVVIAHPYGPLGGSYNNNVVGALLQWFETSSLSAPTTLSTKKPKKAGKRNSSGSRKSSLDQDTGAAAINAVSPTSAKSAGGAQAESFACVICAVNFRYVGSEHLDCHLILKEYMNILKITLFALFRTTHMSRLESYATAI